jgi:non-ribosomal peptide synthetase component F
MKSRLHLRIESQLLSDVRELAAQKRLTLTCLVEQLFTGVVERAREEEQLKNMPSDAEQI